jgi:tRNA pseudouridine13 synthase
LTTTQPAALTPPLEERLTFRWSDLPTVSAAEPGGGGSVRADPDDFHVREVASYLPSGSGSHAYAWVEKVGLTTRDLVRVLVAAGVPPAGIGVAGLKDKVARTWQWLSVPRRFEEAAWGALAATVGVRVVDTSRHRNKLGLGHLQGNRFTVRVRDAHPEAVLRTRTIAALLSEQGVPNYFGPQRFGRFGRNAVDGWRSLHGERVVGDVRLQRFFISALQSQIFNRLLAERVAEGLLTSVLGGDWARKQSTGGTFLVEDAARESLRARGGEISATLPLHGKKVRLSGGEAGVREERALAALGLRWSDLHSRHGDRRLARIYPRDLLIEPEPGGLLVHFELPKGSYATTLLRELLKVDVDAPLDGDSSAP